MTRSPMWNRGATASGTLCLTIPDGLDLAAQFVHGDHAALEERLGDRVNPALVITHLVVGSGAKALDIASELVHSEQPPVLVAEQHHQRIDALFPQGVVMLGRFDRTRREPTHVVVTAWGVGIGHAFIITWKRPASRASTSAPSPVSSQENAARCHRPVEPTSELDSPGAGG